MYIPMEQGEELVVKVHRHWLFIALRVAVLVVLFVAPLVLAELLGAFGIVDFSQASVSGRTTLWALWGIVLWVLFWQFWTTYFMDIWVVTTRRIIDIDYLRLFDRNIAMLRLDRVQDVTTRVRGIVGTLLRFGSVHVQTAGSDKEFIIDQIANPEALRDTISKLAGDAGQLRVIRTE